MTDSTTRPPRTPPTGDGHDGQGVSPEYLRGWKAGRKYATEAEAAAPDAGLREALFRLEGAVQDYIDDPKTMTPLYLEVRNARVALAAHREVRTGTDGDQ